jgi:ferritin-like metal-binding protein YciE
MDMKIEGLQDLFEVELKYAYDCEQKLVDKGLPEMIEAAQSPQLRTALQQHLRETHGQLSRLDQVFSATGIERDTKGNAILKEIMSAAKDSASHIDQSPLRDAALIANGNQVEHYEIALYGTLVAFANQLGLQNVVSLLEQSLKEEKEADAKLNQLAQTINVSATQQSRSARV